MAYVYRHIRTDKNEPFYIGIGKTNDRFRTKHGRNKIWNKIVAKTEYYAEILMDDISWDFAKEKETEFIKLYGRIDLGTGILANLTDGGDGNINFKPSEESRKKMSLSHLGKKLSEKQIENMRKAQQGKIITKETREKMASKLRGRKYPESLVNKMKLYRKGIPNTKCRKPVCKFDINSNFIKEYDGIISAYQEAGGGSYCNLHKNIKGERGHYKNHVYVFKDEMDEMLTEVKNRLSLIKKRKFHPVVNIKTGVIYDSIKIACNSEGLDYKKARWQMWVNKKYGDIELYNQFKTA